ncbi:MAG: hypothetical protein GY943_02140, partial [Chloroflexi bacterium]|nr:hypothetical protein [Chloroflexota bacterium]
RWEQIDTYEWNGIDFAHTVVGDMPPETAVCNIARGILYTNLDGKEKLTVDERIQLLEDALQQIKIEDAPSVDYLSLARVRLAMMYASQGEDDAAMETLREILAYPTRDNEWTQLVINGLELAQDSPVSVCSYLIHTLFVEDNDIFIPDIGEYVMMGGYPVTGAAAPEKICPLNELIQSRLDTLNLPSTIEPKDALETLDLPSITIYSANFDDDSDIEWIGYIDLAMPQVVLLDIVDEKWVAKVLYYDWYPFIVKDYSFFQTLLNENEYQDVLLGLQIETFDFFERPHETKHKVLWIEQADNGFIRAGSLVFYDELPILEGIPLAEFTVNDPQPSIWEPIEAEFNIDGSFRDYVSALAQRVFAQERPSTTLTDLETLLASLPDDDEVQPLRHQLMFLRGYHYELAGEGETAVSHYTTLIQQAPNSPWSWLAWARLEPVNRPPDHRHCGQYAAASWVESPHAPTQ